MSYILDALKKSEAVDNPDVAVAQMAQNTQLQRQQRWLLIAAIALIVNAIVLVIVFAPWRSSDNSNIAHLPSTSTPNQGSTYQKPPIQQAQIARNNDAYTVAEIASTTRNRTKQWPDAPPPTARTSPPKVRTLITLDQLPRADRADYPAMVFSTHIYAEDQDLRALFINGKRRQEGDHIGEAQLLEITETGAEIGYRQYRIRVPVVGGWE